MKKFIKNTLLAFVILYTILNLLLFSYNTIVSNIMTIEIAEEVRSYNQAYEEGREIEISKELELEKEYIQGIRDIYGENALVTRILGYQNYLMGMGQILDEQSTILIATLIFSIAIGIILSLTEKSKTKAIAYFILIGLVLSVLYTMIQLIPNLSDVNFFEGITEEFIYTITEYGIYYIIIYVLVYVGRYILDKKKMRELNKEIEKKNK